MSFDYFSDDCPGCRPALMNISTGEIYAESSPTMQIVLAVWARTTRKERRIFHRVTCLNSVVSSDLRIFQSIGLRFQRALETHSLSLH